jgi:uncharacterized protein
MVLKSRSSLLFKKINHARAIGYLPCPALAEKDVPVTVVQMLELAAAAMVAGAMNALAGGGTLVTFPTLILLGTGEKVANATSTLALVLGTGGSMYGYREHWKAIKPWFVRFWFVSAVGGFLGSVLLTRTSDAFFSKMVPFLILFATVLFVTQDVFRRMAKKEIESSHKRSLSGALIFQFAVAVYGGYFGAGIGILMLASLGILGMKDIHEMNMLKTVLGSLINAVATVWFIFSGLVDWWKAGIMTVGAVIGYYLTARYAQRIPQRRVRQLISAIGFGISGYMFYKQFVK